MPGTLTRNGLDYNQQSKKYEKMNDINKPLYPALS